jgi:hypothetical protein
MNIAAVCFIFGCSYSITTILYYLLNVRTSKSYIKEGYSLLEGFAQNESKKYYFIDMK